MSVCFCTILYTHWLSFQNHFLELDRYYCSEPMLIGIATLFLNGIILITFWRCSRLRASVAFFQVMLQSSVDFGAGIIDIPFAISYLASTIAGVGSCWLVLNTTRLNMTMLIFSIIMARNCGHSARARAAALHIMIKNKLLFSFSFAVK